MKFSIKKHVDLSSNFVSGGCKERREENMSGFFYPNGEKITTIEEFVDFYSKMYFFWQNKEQEDEIVNILREGLFSEYIEEKLNRIKKIMEWKTGIKAQDFMIPVKTKSDEKYINLKAISNSLPQVATPKSFSEMEKIVNVGPVYRITLLFFASKGNYPIYDRFVDYALKAIQSKEDSIPYKKIYKAEDLSDNFQYKYENIYIESLKTLVKDTNIHYCGNADEDRRLDRALWVYGHMFNKTI